MIFAAMKELVAVNPKIKLLLIGEVYNQEKQFVDSFFQENTALRNNIILTGWIDYLEVPRYLARADLGLITMDPRPLNNMLAGPPNKVFNYISSGVPVLSVDFPEIRGLLREYACGLLFTPGSKELFIKNVLRVAADRSLLQIMKANTEKAYAKYNWPEMEKKLFNIYQELVSV